MATPRICSIPGRGKRAPNGDPERYFRNEVLRFKGGDCLPWPYACDPQGRGRIRLNGKTVLVSRAVCEAVNGLPPSPKHEAAHSCGNGHEGCCNPTHLSWKTSAENKADMLTHGTAVRGERHGNAKITEETAREILALKGTMLQREIAELFGIDRRHVNRIHTGKRWAWLK